MIKMKRNINTMSLIAMARTFSVVNLYVTTINAAHNMLCKPATILEVNRS